MVDHRRTVAQWIAREWGFDPDVMARIADEDALAYGKALLNCANGDGKITPQERDWIMGYLTAAGHPDAVLEQLRVYQGTERIEDLVGRSPALGASRRHLVADAIRACSSDGEFHAAERAAVLQMAERMGVDPAVVEQLEAAQHDEQQARQRRFRIACPGGFPY